MGLSTAYHLSMHCVWAFSVTVFREYFWWNLNLADANGKIRCVELTWIGLDKFLSLDESRLLQVVDKDSVHKFVLCDGLNHKHPLLSQVGQNFGDVHVQVVVHAVEKDITENIWKILYGILNEMQYCGYGLDCWKDQRHLQYT